MNRSGVWLARVGFCTLVATGAAACTTTQVQSGSQAGYAPRTPDGLPDLQGIWQTMNAANVSLLAHRATPDGPGGQSVVDGGVLPYQEWAIKKQQENFAKRMTLDGERKCFLAGVPRATYIPLPFQIVQTPRMTAILYEYAHMERRIYTDGTPHQLDIDFYLGDSRGHYEGNSLVAEVTNFNDMTWFDRAGNFHSDQMKVVERFTRTDRDHIDYEATVTDPKVFTRPWKIQMPLYRRTEPKAQILDYQCYAFEETTPDITVPLFRESPLK